ncbi:transposable element Tcb1 transposase [Trichonephila clavipes]|nr:transposable element Tcb1 transposase [Trichonephila clavipes]
MQEETLDGWSQLNPPLCTTAFDNRRILDVAVLDRATTSRTIAQQIHYVMHPSVSTRTIERCLWQSGMLATYSRLRSPLTGNHGRLHRQWYDEWRKWTTGWYDIVY